jgi:hypothetical protein
MGLPPRWRVTDHGSGPGQSDSHRIARSMHLQRRLYSSTDRAARQGGRSARTVFGGVLLRGDRGPWLWAWPSDYPRPSTNARLGVQGLGSRVVGSAHCGRSGRRSWSQQEFFDCADGVLGRATLGGARVDGREALSGLRAQRPEDGIGRLFTGNAAGRVLDLTKRRIPGGRRLIRTQQWVPARNSRGMAKILNRRGCIFFRRGFLPQKRSSQGNHTPN